MEKSSKVKFEYIPFAKLVFLENNPRTRTQKGMERMAADIKKDPSFYENRPTLVNVVGGEFRVYAGDLRAHAAHDVLGWESIPCNLEGDVPNDVQARRAILDNTHHENWDSDLLANWGFDVDELGEMSVPGWVYGADESEGGVPNNALNSEAQEDDFEVPEVETVKTDIVLGDLFEIGPHRLLCGDSTDSDSVAKLMNGEKADMVFTDPPFPNNSEIMHEMIKNIDSAFNNSRIFCDGLMIWFWDNLEFPPFLEQVTSKHIWHKTNGWQAGHFETMYCYHNDSKRHEQKVYSINNVGGENNREEQGNHPTPKPISLVFNIVNDLSKNSKLILDLFLGSGTTMVASHQLKRKCYGMELIPKYCQVIVDRMLKLDPTLEVKKNGVLYERKN